MFFFISPHTNYYSEMMSTYAKSLKFWPKLHYFNIIFCIYRIEYIYNR